MSFCRETERKARKQHKCSLCGAVIRVGETYLDHADNMIDSATVYQGKECLPCQPVKKEFLSSSYADEGYNEENIREWWCDTKCWECENHYPVVCKPSQNCANTSPNECKWNRKGKCTADESCDDMTHYCRCENFKQISRIEGEK